jgi:PAS domain S-box-containing protein
METRTMGLVSAKILHLPGWLAKHMLKLVPLLIAAAILVLLATSADQTIEILQVAGITFLLSLALLLVFFQLHREQLIKASLRMELDHVQDSELIQKSRLNTLGSGYKHLFRGNPIPMWVFDLETLRFVEVNDAAVAHYGYSRDEFLGMTVCEMRTEADCRKLKEYISQNAPGLKYAGVWRHRKKDGSFIDVQIASHELQWNGRNCRFVSANDITERIRAEDALKRLNANLESLVRDRTEELRNQACILQRHERQLEIANRELETFSYSVSHDLKSPLFVMSTFTQLLADEYKDKQDTKIEGYLHNMREACLWMSSLIENLLKLSHATRVELRRTDVDLSARAAEIAATLRMKDPTRDVEFDIQLGVVVEADAGLMLSVLENLIGNAWKFSSKSPAAKISFGTLNTDDNPVYYVRDNGAGFDMRRAGRLFTAFQRLHGESDFKGTGIGLATVSRIVDRHGGRIWAEAQVGNGAAFYFTLGSQAQLRSASKPAARLRLSSAREAPAA